MAALFCYEDRATQRENMQPLQLSQPCSKPKEVDNEEQKPEHLFEYCSQHQYWRKSSIVYGTLQNR